LSIGAFFRQRLGSLEKPVSDIYRAVFFSLEDFVDQIGLWQNPLNILEVGCGEGAVIERLATIYQNANITGIDITPKVGRMFSKPPKRVTFKNQGLQDYVSEHPNSSDLVIFCDVLHHIPWEMHEEILLEAKKALRPSGYIVLKDWERDYTPIYWLCYFLDRYITGDRIKYKNSNELRKLIQTVLGVDSIKAEKRIGPWPNNIVFLIQV